MGFGPAQGASGGVSSSALDTTFGNTQGDMLYRNASAWVALAPGTSGQVLQTGGASANLSWGSAGAGAFPLLAPNGSGGAPSYSFTNQTGTGIFYTTSGPAGLNVAHSGVQSSLFTGNGGLLGGAAFLLQAPINLNLTGGPQYLSQGSFTVLSGATTANASMVLQDTFADGGVTSSGTVRGMWVSPTINFTAASKTGHYEALTISATETSLPTGTNYLIRTQAGAAGTTDTWTLTNAGIENLLSTGQRTWNGDVGLARQGAAGVLGLVRTGTLGSPAELRIYNTTDAASGAPTNSEYLGVSWAGNLCTIQTNKTGTGTLRALTVSAQGGDLILDTTSPSNGLRFSIGGTIYSQFTTGGILQVLVGGVTGTNGTQTCQQITGPNGSSIVFGVLKNNVTTSSGTSVNLGTALPAGSFVLGACYRITTTVTGPTGNLQLQDAGGNVYVSQATLTAGTTATGFLFTTANNYTSANAFKIVSTATAFTGGVVEVEIYYATITPPTS